MFPIIFGIWTAVFMLIFWVTVTDAYLWNLPFGWKHLLILILSGPVNWLLVVFICFTGACASVLVKICDWVGL